MGATYVDVTIRNPADLQRSWTGAFLVDTGAFDSLVPRDRLEAIGLKPKGRREYTLADGTGVSMEITTADLEFEGEVVGGTIVYGEDGAEPPAWRNGTGVRRLRGGPSQRGIETVAWDFVEVNRGYRGSGD